MKLVNWGVCIYTEFEHKYKAMDMNCVPGNQDDYIEQKSYSL